MKINHKKLFAIIFFLLFIFSLKGVFAANIVGVSPGVVHFKNVLKGGYAEREIGITVSTDKEVKARLESRGDISEWLNFTSNISISRSDPNRVLISVMPPSDMPNGNYSGFVRIYTDPIGSETDGPVGSVVRTVIDVTVLTEITDVEILKCTARDFQVHSAEKGDNLIFNMDVLNQGNIRLKPKVLVNIWDKEQISIVKSLEFKGNEIFPTKEQQVVFNLSSNDLDPDQYWVEIEVPDCFSNSEILTFDVFEPGTLKAQGVLMRIISSIWAEVDETIPIYATFKNIGEKDVDSQFRGKITYNGKIMQVLESEKRNVPINELTNFTFFFTPRKAGKYIASGRVFYDKKLTYESSTVINIMPKNFGIKDVFLIIVYIAILIFIVLLFIKIRKEKKRYLRYKK